MTKRYNQIDWVHYLTRPREFFLINLLVSRFKGTDLKHTIGFGHDYWLFTNHGGDTMDLYRRKEELQKSDQFARRLIQQKTKLEQLFSKGRVAIKEIEALITDYKKHKSISSEQLQQGYLHAINQIINYFIYAIEIPYLVGGILETDALTNAARFQWILKACEYFRGVSYYPDFHKFVLTPLMRSIARSARVNVSNLQLVTHHEILVFLNGKLLRGELRRRTKARRSGFLCFSAFGNEKFVKDKKFLIAFARNVDRTIREIRGKVAHKGVVQGTAKVIISQKEFDKVRKGDVLITIQSNPSFMPILKKCSAIVADEGGIMSHAAIVSRELGIPCIIGTKIATKVFKDGELVEVDAEKGIVRKI